jgi:hypothetical protein
VVYFKHINKSLDTKMVFPGRRHFAQSSFGLLTNIQLLEGREREGKRERERESGHVCLHTHLKKLGPLTHYIHSLNLLTYFKYTAIILCNSKCHILV